MAPVVLFGDGDQAIGAGHQIRLAAIADALHGLGIHPQLACRDLPGSTHVWAWRGREMRLLPAGLTAQAACAAAGALVVDHYGVDRAPGCVALVDGPGLGPPQGAALAVCPRPGALPAEVPGLPCLAGAAFVPLRPTFAARRGPRSDGPVLVACGATDASGTGARIAAALAAAGHATATLPGSADASAVTDCIAGCRAAVVSASTIALECLSLGVPVIAVVTAANQQRLAAGLSALGVPVLASDQLDDLAARLHTAQAPTALDGQGATRIATRIAELVRWPAASCLRWACWDDADRLLDWANDPVTRAASFSNAAITRDGHLAWLARTLADPESRLWLGQVDGQPAGTVRLARADGAATVSIGVAPEARGRGVGRRLLADLTAWNTATAFAPRLDAWVRDGNDASHRLFSGCGWPAAARGAVAGQPATRYVWPPETAP